MKTMIKCFWIFLFGSFIGCLVEELWCLMKKKCFQIRSSLMHLPLIPIYGFACLFIIIVADKVGYSLWKVFLIGCVIATLIEYFSSYIQEKVFKTKSWDYSDFKFNLNGRVNLVYSLGFGLISMLIIKYIKKFAILITGVLNSSFVTKLTLIVFVIFIFDVFISSLACIRYSKRKEGKEPITKLGMIIDMVYPDNKVEKIYNNSVYVG